MVPVPLTKESHGLKLGLADGQQWLIRPVDDRAAVIVAELGEVMGLGPGVGGRELCVAVCEESERPDLEAGGAVVCRIGPAVNRETVVVQMRRIASQVAREAMARGGLLFHGALAEYRGNGFLMAGPSEVGKSTASRRLPPPWNSLSDDMTLVVRDGNGRFWAHPWPTWSRFLYGGPGGSWAVERAVPLRAIFFLDQSPVDRLEPIRGTQVTALAMESAEELAREVLFVMTDPDAVRMLCSKALGVAKALASAVPAYSLKLSLDGRFWDEIERVLPAGGPPETGAESRRQDPSSVEALTADDALRVVCTGTSMIPTLSEPDLLEVRPYGTARPRPGDVVCFKSPETGKTIVHRVVSVGGPRNGIVTRGDNCPADDAGVRQDGDIVGRVLAAQRGDRRRAIAGGWRGLAGLWFARLGRGIWRLSGLVPHKLYYFAAGLGPFDRLLPSGLRPRLVRFGTRYRVFPKLLMGSRTIGHYDHRIKKWRIRRPYLLFVREQALDKALALNRLA